LWPHPHGGAALELVVEVEVSRGALLEPQPIAVGRVPKKVWCLLEHVVLRLGPLGAGVWSIAAANVFVRSVGLTARLG
jgi:hypothetical protein